MRQVRIFVSYSHDDRQWVDEQSEHSLIPWLARSLRRDNVIVWYDDSIRAGDQWRQTLELEIDRADIALLMVSQQFLNSEYIGEHELPRIRDRAERGQLDVVPILAEPCAWEEIHFIARWQIIPGGPTPLIDYTESPRQWTYARHEVLTAIKERVAEVRVRPPSPVPGQPTPAHPRSPHGGELATTLAALETGFTQQVGDALAALARAGDHTGSSPQQHDGGDH